MQDSTTSVGADFLQSHPKAGAIVELYNMDHVNYDGHDGMYCFRGSHYAIDKYGHETGYGFLSDIDNYEPLGSLSSMPEYGEWPYVVNVGMELNGEPSASPCFCVLSYCEGDMTLTIYETKATAKRVLDNFYN